LEHKRRGSIELETSVQYEFVSIQGQTWLSIRHDVKSANVAARIRDAGSLRFVDGDGSLIIYIVVPPLTTTGINAKKTPPDRITTAEPAS
jgi:hypothetical protein